MPLSITINQDSPEESDRSSLGDEDDSSGVEVSPPSVTGSNGYQDYDDWAHLHYPDELRSDSASRPRASRVNRSAIPQSRSRSGRRYSRRDLARGEYPPPRSRRHRSPEESPESLDSSEEDLDPGYGRQPSDRRHWPPVAPGVVGGYAHSSSSGPSYHAYQPGGMGHLQFGHPGAPAHPPHPSDQLVRLGHMGRPGQYGPHPPFGYGSQYPPAHHGGVPPLYSPEPPPGHPAHLPPHPHASESRDRSRGQSPPEQPIAHMMPPHANPHFGAPPFPPPDLIPFHPGGYFPFNQNYPGGVVGHPFFGGPVPQKSESPSSTSQSDTAKDEAIARLEKLILDERAEREARDAAREAAIAKAAADKLAAEERAAAEKKIADEAAAKATAAANAEAERKLAEEAAKAQKAAEEMAAAAAAEAKKAAEEAAAAAAEEAKKAADEAAAAAVAEAKKAAEEAAAAAAAAKPPPEKKKPIKFKDAINRKFNFPFHLCNTWQGMEELIRQAFLHVEGIGPHVAEGHYDLVGPSGDIILPQVWDTVVEPDWTVTMHMWPIPEKPKEEPPPPPPPEEPAAPPAEEPKKKADGAAPKKPRPANPGSFARWMVGNNRPKPGAKPLKVEKKPEIVQHTGDSCVAM